MERLVNKKVRLQNRYTKTFLVACSDKESVNHVSLDSNKPKPGNSVWVIKSKNPKKSVRLESVYGKFLGHSETKGIIICQVDKKAEEGLNWWTFEDVDSSGFTCVQIKLRHSGHKVIYLSAAPTGSEVMVGMIDSAGWSSWAGPERFFRWDLEIVETPPPPPPSLALTPTLKPAISDEIPTAGCIYQVQQMNVLNICRKSEGMPANVLPYGSYDVNTGRNTNGSGTQIVEGVTIQTWIDQLVNKNIVRRDA